MSGVPVCSPGAGIALTDFSFVIPAEAGSQLARRSRPWFSQGDASQGPFVKP
jgi:hypothetical protein